MKVDIFPVSVFIGNIDLKKIKLTSEMGKAFLSETPTSFLTQNSLDPESGTYLMQVIAELLREKFHTFFTVRLSSIWRNKYKDNDYQEPHVHTNSKFSFIIYEEVNKVHTVFYNPAKYLIEATLGTDLVQFDFIPKMKKGQIIVFPSYVEHMVTKNSDQATISGNINFEFNIDPSFIKKEGKEKI